MIGKRILNYEIKKLLGEGGMGNVYVAEHTQLGRKVAIKSLHQQLVKNEGLRARFKNEASTMAHLQHPKIVTLYDYVEEKDGLFLVMEFVEGLPLDEYIKEKSGPIPSEIAIPMMMQILDAFSYAHSKGIVHRDIKPSNIIISDRDEIKILDFGIAKLLSEAGNKLTKTGTQMGTVFYMSPEQVQGKEIDIRSDIYSLGVTFYQMLTGISPYDGMTTEFEVYSKIVSEPLPNASTIYPGVPEFLDKVILKATAKNMANRFQSCDEFSKYLSEKKTPVIEQKTVANPIIASTPPLPEENVVKMPKISTLEIIPIILVTLVVIFLIYSASKGNNAATTEMASIDSVTTNPNISPESVMNTIFQAANTGEVEILKFLLPPYDEQQGRIPCDGDCKGICNPGDESMRDELSGNYVTLDEFKNYFSKAYVIGIPDITEDRAKVNFVFGPNLESNETMNLQRINGNWYLSSF